MNPDYTAAPAPAPDPPQVTVVLGIKPWKRWQIRPFIQAPAGRRLHFARTPAEALSVQARCGGGIAVWASREPEDFAAAAAAQSARLLRIEDGFLRSVGLGSNHVGGASLVLDDVGIYYDPRRPSALEILLQTHDFPPLLIARAARLRARLVAAGLTKYNVGTRAPVVLGGAPGQRRVLVVGQVENDASVRSGSALVRDNHALLQRVREAEPHAWIIYKPHPDTEAGTRPGALAEATVLRLADQIVRDVSVTALFPEVEALHTLTSLAGFEALLRGLPVVTWGQPFYAGWGLTEDRLPPDRRSSRLSLDQLVAGTLILYPRYVRLDSGAPCEVEDVVETLAAAGVAAAATERSALRRVARLCAGWLRGLIPPPRTG